MVKLEEVADEALYSEQKANPDAPGVAGANPFSKDDEDDWDTDSESEISSTASEVDGDDDVLEESLLDRLAALKDIIPPSARRSIASTVSSTSAYGKWGLGKAASAGWIVGVSVLLLVAPFAIASIEEQGYVMEEREREMRERGVNEMMAPSANAGPGAGASPTAAVQGLQVGNVVNAASTASQVQQPL